MRFFSRWRWCMARWYLGRESAGLGAGVRFIPSVRAHNMVFRVEKCLFAYVTFECAYVHDTHTHAHTHTLPYRPLWGGPVSSRPQPALPGASHGQRGSCTAGPPHLAQLWTPAATLQAFGVGREVHSEYSYACIHEASNTSNPHSVHKAIHTYVYTVCAHMHKCVHLHIHTHTHMHTHTLPHM